MIDRRPRLFISVLLFVALAIRLAWALHQPSDEAAIARLPDQREYLDLGAHLFHGGLWMADTRFSQIVYAYRTPGYPLLIALCDARPLVVRIAQCVLDTSTVLAVYLLARRWLLPRGAVVAAALVAFNPYLIFFTGLILSETLYTAMLAWGLALLVISDGPWPPGNKLLGWLGGGGILALSILVRPGTLLMPVVVGIAAALANREVVRSYRSSWPLPVGAMMLLLTFLALFPWAARNRWTLGDWIWTSTNDGITRYDGFNPNATGASDQGFVGWMPWTADMTEVGRSKYFSTLADEWMREHKSEALRLAAVKIGRTWSPVPLSKEYGSRWVYTVVGLVYGVILDVGVLVGLRSRVLGGAVKRVLLAPAVYFTVAAALSVGSLRYRVPAEAPMAILAASAVGIPRRSF